MAYYKYKIANLNVTMNLQGEKLKNQAIPYLFEFDCKPDIYIDFDKTIVENYQKKHPTLSYDECEYIIAGIYFYKQALKFDGFLIHSSAVVYKDSAFCFTAPSGTGKSTHTSLWLNNLKDSYILNDDKPLIRIINNEILIFGTPFSGKSNISVNKGVKLKAITYLTRGAENYIFEVNTPQAINILLWQTSRSTNYKVAEQILSLIDKILKKVKVYEMCCDISENAFITSFEKLTNEKFVI